MIPQLVFDKTRRGSKKINFFIRVMARPIIITSDNHFAPLPTNESLQVGEAANTSDAVTLGQLNEAIASIDVGNIDLTGYATETWVQEYIANFEFEGGNANMVDLIAWENITDKPLTFPPSVHTHTEFYTKLEVDALLSQLSTTINGIGFFFMHPTAPAVTYVTQTQSGGGPYSPTADDRKCLLSFSAFARRCRIEIGVEITALQRTSTSVTVPSVLTPNDAIQAVKTEIEPITVLQFSLAHTAKTGYYTYSAGGLGQLKFGYAGYDTPPDGDLYVPRTTLWFNPTLYHAYNDSNSYNDSYKYWATIDVKVFDLDTELLLYAYEADNYQFQATNTWHNN
jgi:hypothetical protein